MSEVALVTGGSRGIGKALAIALAQSGRRVAAASRRPAGLSDAGILSLAADVTSEADVRAMVAAVEEKLGPIDLLVNNAGIGGPFGPTWETDAAEWWRCQEVNYKGPFLCSHAVLPGMVARRRGRIINIASGAGTVSIPYMSAYVTGKAALIRLTEVLAGELRRHGVSVFAIQPGTVRTDMSLGVVQSEAGRRWLPWVQEVFDKHEDVTTQPAEELVLYLAGGKADALSGRLFSAPGAPANLEGAEERILRDDLNVLRLR